MPDDSPPTVPAWDFYPCKVDQAPASILVDLSLGEPSAERVGEVLYVVRILMAEPGEHGMGEPAEFEVLGPLEERLASVAAAHGARFVGRLRNQGRWQVAFMGPRGIEDALGNLGLELLDPTGRDHDLVFQEDPTWSYFDGFLYPDPERLRWMRDRALVEALREGGDDPAAVRRVDHHLELPTRTARNAAAGEAIDLGFRAVDPAPGERSALHLHHEDRVELEHVHVVVMGLSALAAKHGGRYVGWTSEAAR